MEDRHDVKSLPGDLDLHNVNITRSPSIFHLAIMLSWIDQIKENVNPLYKVFSRQQVFVYW